MDLMTMCNMKQVNCHDEPRVHPTLQPSIALDRVTIFSNPQTIYAGAPVCAGDTPQAFNQDGGQLFQCMAHLPRAQFNTMDSMNTTFWLPGTS